MWHAWFRLPGVAEGIHAAAMLNMFCREAGAIGMTIGAYFEPVNEGGIRVEPDSARLTPAGQVFSLFRPHHGNRAVEVERAPADAELDAAVSVREEENELTVTLVNRSPEAPCRAELVLENAGGIAGAAGFALTSPDLLPESEFTREELEIAVKDGAALEATVPRYSVARIQITYR